MLYDCRSYDCIEFGCSFMGYKLGITFFLFSDTCICYSLKKTNRLEEGASSETA